MRGNYHARTNLDADMGLYAQDRWTMDRLTVSGAIRFDWFRTSFPEQTLGPVPLAPNRNITFPAADNINWKDLTYRSGFSYDLFGTGKTAVKFSYNKYLLGQTLNGLGREPNPLIVAGAVAPTRTWNDANRDFVPQCDLTNLLANGECAQASNLAFGSAVATEQFDKDLITGFNHRQTNWETSVSLVHELMPRVGIDVGYFRRSWANFRVTDNLAVDARRLHAVRHRQSRRCPVGGRQRGHGARLRGRGADQVRPGEQLQHAVHEDRRSDRGVAGRGLHRQRSAAERAEHTGRRQHRLDA